MRSTPRFALLASMLGSVLARATDAPGAGAHWGAEAWHPHLPRGQRNLLQQVGGAGDSGSETRT